MATKTENLLSFQRVSGIIDDVLRDMGEDDLRPVFYVSLDDKPERFSPSIMIWVNGRSLGSIAQTDTFRVYDFKIAKDTNQFFADDFETTLMYLQAAKVIRDRLRFEVHPDEGGE